MNDVLGDDSRLLSRERNARRVGRLMIASRIAETMGTVGTIAAAGSVAGLSGARITSGLAAIRSVVGGGSAGIAITVAAPAVATIAISYETYKIWQYVTE